MKKFLLLFIIHFFFNSIIAQNILKLKGIVISEKDNNPLGYCPIQYNSLGQSIFTNESGEFEIKYVEKNIKDSLFVKYLGFIDKKISVNDINFENYLVIKMSGKNIDLNEIEIFPNPSEGIIINNILSNSSLNYYTKNTYSNGFFRRYVKSDNHFDKLVEGDIILFNDDFNSKKQKWNKHTVYINELRATENLGRIKEGESSNANNLNEILSIYEGMLNDFFLHPMYPFKYKLKDVEYYENYKILTLSFEYSNPSGGFICQGNFKINDKTWAVEELVYNWKITDKKEKQLYSSMDTLKLRNLSDDIMIKFRQINNIYYVSLIKRDYVKEIYPNNNNSFLYSINTEYSLNNVYAEIISTKGKKILNRNEGLYKQACHSVYNPNFWKNYNLLVDNPELEKVRKELNLISNIDEQFNNANKYPTDSKKGKK